MQNAGIDWRYIAPGTPEQNGIIESFNCKLRPSHAYKHALPGSG
ncbi:transposase [Rhodobacteraceae bacterium M385]|nr:transposase [Rhodobacteraceae bacterium M385]